MRSFVKGVFLSLAFILLFVSCGETGKKDTGKPEGSEGGPCYGNKTCDDGLTCVSDLCVDLNELSDNDSGNTGNSGDSGNTGNTGDTGDLDDFDCFNDVDIFDYDEGGDIDSDSDSDIDVETIPDDDLIIPPFCGNGELDEGEECDDGNKINTDSCKRDCTFNVCGDGYVYNGNETCDSNTSSCLSIGIGTDGTAQCNEECDYWITAGICTRDQICSGLPVNAEWNTASIVNQVWDGLTWQPTTSGSYNTTPSVTKCIFKCKDNYSWNESQCIADIRTDQSCVGLPANASWNIATSISQTWSGTDWTPSTTGAYNTTASTIQCRFKCNENYTWNSEISQCVADTRNQSCVGLPSDASWNTASSITQTWNGTDWLPTTTGVFSTEGSTIQCRFKCNTNYSWNSLSSTCVADTKVSNCTGLPDNAFWNEVSFITQTWSGSAWTPSTTGTHNLTSSTTECRFRCNPNYSWNSISSTCVADTQTANCPAKPVTGTAWNDSGKNGTYTQTWNGSSWAPVNTTTYNTTAGDCRYKCATNYTWNSGSSTCVANTQTANCPAKPSTGTVWNDSGKNGTYTQSWNGSAWAPVNTTTYNTTAGDCRYKCATNYTWNSSSSTCVADTKASDCSGLPNKASWNTVSSITQTWNGSSWLPSTIGVYNTTASTTECRFKCNTNYSWNSGTSTCVADTKTFICAAKPGAGSVWNTVSSYSQTWSGSAWLPAETVTEYNETADTKSCRFKCSFGYIFDGDICQPYNPQVICTGHTKCYNNSGSITCPATPDIAFYGQDAQYAALGYCKPISYTILTTGAEKRVLDNNTGLQWVPTQTASPLWSDAVSHCNNKVYSGYSDWRLPTKMELATIVDISRSEPSYDGEFFLGINSGWSSSVSKYFSDERWYVEFFYGGSNTAPITGNYRGAVCVRGAVWYLGNIFVEDNIGGEIVVTDTKTNLKWTKDYVIEKDWQQALDYCETREYGGYDNWRLPNINELKTLFNVAFYNPASSFPGMQSDMAFWSSSSVVGALITKAWYINFRHGNDYYADKTAVNSVICVR